MGGKERSVMKGQLVKDFTEGKFNLIGILGVYAAWLVMSQFGMKMGHMFFSVIIGALFSSLIVYDSMSADEKSGYMINAFSSPISRKDYVIGKYLFALINILISIIPSACLAIFATEHPETMNTSDIIIQCIKMLGISVFIQILADSFFISMSIKNKAFQVLISFCVIVFMLSFIIGFITVGVDELSDAEGVPFPLKKYVSVMIIIGTFVEALMVIMSFKWAERREV